VAGGPGVRAGAGTTRDKRLDTRAAARRPPPAGSARAARPPDRQAPASITRVACRAVRAARGAARPRARADVSREGSGACWRGPTAAGPRRPRPRGGPRARQLGLRRQAGGHLARRRAPAPLPRPRGVPAPSWSRPIATPRAAPHRRRPGARRVTARRRPGARRATARRAVGERTPSTAAWAQPSTASICPAVWLTLGVAGGRGPRLRVGCQLSRGAHGRVGGAAGRRPGGAG
jgi:hypothetical protein